MSPDNPFVTLSYSEGRQPRQQRYKGVTEALGFAIFWAHGNPGRGVRICGQGVDLVLAQRTTENDPLFPYDYRNLEITSPES